MGTSSDNQPAIRPGSGEADDHRCGLPFGFGEWVEELSTRLGHDLKIRPRGRPHKTQTTGGM